MLGYSTETSASMSRHQYSHETVREDSTLHNTYNIENVDEYDRPEISQNNLSYDNKYHDEQYYNLVRQSDDYFHPSTSGEQYQSDEYHNCNETREQWEDDQNMDWTEGHEPLSYNSRPKLMHPIMFPMRRRYRNNDSHTDDDEDDNGDNDDDDGDNEMVWHDYPTFMQNKSSPATGQYDMPPSESERESFSHTEIDHYMKESDEHDHETTLSKKSIQLPNGSIGPFNDTKCDLHKKHYSSIEKQQMKSNSGELSRYSFEGENNNDIQSKTMRVKFTAEMDNKQSRNIEVTDVSELSLSRKNYRNLWHRAYEDVCQMLGIKVIF
ncbi:unnamed protein product [Cercopithifilaria johnstoni]|uniref:Uncharacterized protein n=1 Tax=Cercopithifilaria johnstoni TaxID=2874296 RepID=A0A8J2PQ17_9BILA|nr:unnamed protein product [Cercopithifilaria johnstoni]